MMDYQELVDMGIPEDRTFAPDKFANKLTWELRILSKRLGESWILHLTEWELEHLHRDVVQARFDLINAKKRVAGNIANMPA